MKYLALLFMLCGCVTTGNNTQQLKCVKDNGALGGTIQVVSSSEYRVFYVHAHSLDGKLVCHEGR